MQSTRVAGLAGMLLCATAQAGTTTLTVRDAAAGQGNSFYTPLLFTTLHGQILLSLALVLNVAAYLWANRILNADI